ncbi:MAG: hypothetical protein OXK81_14185 [Chloroflexota bacterium]|nr:hypothetical protein [Chloroflexota bacterium]
MGWGSEHFAGDAEPHSNTVALPAARFDSNYVAGSLPLHSRITPASNTRNYVAMSTASGASESEWGISRVGLIDAPRSAGFSMHRQETSRVLWGKAGYIRSAPELLLESNRDAWLNRNLRAIQPLFAVPAELPAPPLVIPEMVHAELDAFAEGIGDVRPSGEVVMMAFRIARVVVANVEHPDILMDIDGELSFDLLRKDGRLVLAEMEVNGTIHASLYDCQNSLLEYMPSATEAEFTSLFQP